VETDCDARVLARGAGKPLHYARVLVDVGTRATDAVPMGAGFGERAPQLERRVRAMLEGTLGFGWKGLALRLAFAGLLVAAACTLDFDVTTYNVATPDAASARPDLPEAPAAPTVPASGASVRDVIEKGPSFTPFTVAPTILNRDEITHAMDAAYPPLLREAGIGGAVQVYFYIDAEGAVQDTRVSKSSGHQALDQAAIRVAKLFRFSPALNRDKKVAVWVSFPITFQVK
jgi:TonB family protein